MLVRDRYPSGLPAHFATEIVTAVAGALDYAHQRGLLHRDVKPANILLGDFSPTSQEHRIMLSDFGIARSMEDVGGLTATNMTVGSIAYMAPEQLMGEPLDGRADQYALAASAFQLLTGKLPFDSSNAAVVISSHLSGSPPRLAGRRPDLAELDAAISKGMAKQAVERYSTCRDFAKALAELVDSPESVAHATMLGRQVAKSFGDQITKKAAAAPSVPKPGVDTATPSGEGTKRRGRRGIWIAAAVLSTALLVAGGFVLVPRLMRAESGAAAESALPLVPESAADGLLVAPDQVNVIVGQSLEEVSTSSGPFDSSGSLNRPNCSGAIYPIESRVYDPTGYTAIRESLLQTPAGSPSNYMVDQAVALLPSAERAEQMRADSEQQWQDCAGNSLTIINERGSPTRRWQMWPFTTI